ncbi:helix-turn-helix domain-containing protein [Streptomyces sp. CL7]|uniref:helix-turn-helix domain-containing protein n=1 Tax=Streptomyces sp. CL7 TaxID=3096006 RepID=UPI002A74F7C1|nr:helix-turn-helix domain-containing protein [Streptomyces sp. CL7]WPP29990.1 helix-turn-helix domain-containing protein [Streptomyces sp. CL7]
MTRRLTYPEAAAELGVTETWLRRHIKKLPHSKPGRVVYFTDADLERIDRLFHHEPSTGPLATAPAPTATGPHPLAGLRPLPPRGKALTHAS